MKYIIIIYIQYISAGKESVCSAGNGKEYGCRSTGIIYTWCSEKNSPIFLVILKLFSKL